MDKAVVDNGVDIGAVVEDDVDIDEAMMDVDVANVGAKELTGVKDTATATAAAT